MEPEKRGSRASAVAWLPVAILILGLFVSLVLENNRDSDLQERVGLLQAENSKLQEKADYYKNLADIRKQTITENEFLLLELKIDLLKARRR